MERISSLPPGMDLDSLPNIICECGHDVFEQGFIIKKLSSFLTQDGHEQRFLIPVILCKKCGKELEEESKKYMEKGEEQCLV